MGKAYKVFGGFSYNHNEKKHMRVIIAETSRKKAAEKIGISANYIRTHFSITGNSGEIELATTKKGEPIWINKRSI